MKVYLVEEITEADFGCEETGRKEPAALLKLVFENEEKYVEVPESELEVKGISEGKKVIISGDGKVLKYVRVVAAVIKATNENKEPIIFATQRGYGEYKDGWEFPGGKIEKGEKPEEAIIREIKEELDTNVAVESYLDTIEYDYLTFHLSMDCFICSIVDGDLVLKEHEAARWLNKEQLYEVDWLPADITIIEKVKEKLFK